MSRIEMNKYIKLFLDDHNLRPYERFTFINAPENMYFYFSSGGEVMCEDEDGAEYTGLLKQFLDGIEIEYCEKEPDEPFYPTPSDYVWYLDEGHAFQKRYSEIQMGIRPCRTVDEAFHYHNIMVDYYKSTLIYNPNRATYVITYNYETQKLEIRSDLKDIPINCRAFTTEAVADDFIYRWGEEFVLHYLLNVYKKGV